MEAGEKKKRACVVPVCKDERFDLVHKLPMNAERADEWINSLGIPELRRHSIDELRKRIFVCCRHFRKQDYKNVESRHLNKTAVPSINLKELDNFNVIDQSVMVKTIPEPEVIVPHPMQKVQPIVQRTRVKPDTSTSSRLLNAVKRKRKSEEHLEEEVLDDNISLNISDSRTSKIINQPSSTNHYFILPCVQERPRKRVLQKLDDDVSDLLVFANLPEVAEQIKPEELPRLSE